MAAGIVYLDVDDEITSAASRIRDAPGRRVALVLPYGSRVATSRINFRLLSRDAIINEKQLAVVAGDSATRALAASAGLPVFASIGEYEASLPASASEAEPPQDTPPVPPTPPAPPKTDPISPTSPDTASAAPIKGKSRRSKRAAAVPQADDSDPTAAIAASPVVAPEPPKGRAPQGDAQATIPWEGADAETRAWREPPWIPPATTRPPTPESVDTRAAARGSRSSSRVPIAIALAAIALVVLVGGVGAYVLLPSATIVVTPRAEPLAPLEITVTADPSATAPDAAARVVPASVVALDVDAEDTFQATGKRIEEEAAHGTVRFSNLDVLRTNRVPAGSIVSTNAGARFSTDKAVTVPRANLVGLTVFPGRITVTVTAVEPGLGGNVEPNTIVVVPRGEDPQALKVVNPDSTSGGTHEEFPQVSQADVDGALAQLRTSLDQAFQDRLADPSIAAPGATVFAETASLEEPTPTVDPTTLVEQEVESFHLGLAASGTVVTVDPAPVAAIAGELIRSNVEPGHQLVADSVEVEVGQPVVSGRTVAFDATATASQVAVLDADELKAMVLGKPLDAARSILSPYGDVELTAWPDWVGSVPSLADRVDVRIDESVPVETPATSGSQS